jgi:predicted nucleic acid-binding protein
MLVDEVRARRAARDQGIEVIGTLRILDQAKRSGYISLVRPLIAQMQSEGYRFERALILRFLEIVGEG